MQTNPGSALMIEVGAGELIDKITILRIKRERITDAAKRHNVVHELGVLEAAGRQHLSPSAELARLESELQAINEALWQVEDDIRDCEARADFGEAFIALARSVYRLNDQRAAIKRAINLHCGSGIIEEKSYSGAP
ncbi:MAG: hypothetical protein H4O13_14375 [Xanthomonadales bacterium]|nr:hypothetical protein [Xanthomonadales bacterium]